MVARNEHTGDALKTKLGDADAQKKFEDNFDRIFRKNKDDVAKPTSTPTQPAEYAEDWQSSERDRAIAQNGNVGYGEEVNDK